MIGYEQHNMSDVQYMRYNIPGIYMQVYQMQCIYYTSYIEL